MLQFCATFTGLSGRSKYETISDIVVHINYTSKDGGDKLKNPATDALMGYMKNVEDLSQREGLFAMFDVKNDFPNEWYKAMLLPPGPGGRVMELGKLMEKLPFYTKNASIKSITAKDIYFVADNSFKITDLNVFHNSVALTVSFEGPEKINDSTHLYHLSDVNLSINKITDKWSLKFADSIAEPVKMWIVMRYFIG